MDTNLFLVTCHPTRLGRSSYCLRMFLNLKVFACFFKDRLKYIIIKYCFLKYLEILSEPLRNMLFYFYLVIDEFLADYPVFKNMTESVFEKIRNCQFLIEIFKNQNGFR